MIMRLCDTYRAAFDACTDNLKSIHLKRVIRYLLAPGHDAAESLSHTAEQRTPDTASAMITSVHALHSLWWTIGSWYGLD